MPRPWVFRAGYSFSRQRELAIRGDRGDVPFLESAKGKKYLRSRERGRVGRRHFAGQPCGYGWGFSDAGFTSAALERGVFDLGAAAASICLGRQKSAATWATSSGGLLSSGEKCMSEDSVLSTISAFMCWNFL